MEHKYGYTTIDLNAWSRGKHFALYKDCGFPFVGVTTNIDVSRLVDAYRREKTRFFAAFVHLLVSSISRFDNFRLRMLFRVKPSDKSIEHYASNLGLSLAK